MADIVSERLLAITGMHEADVLAVFSAHLISLLIALGTLGIVVYAVAHVTRAKVARETSQGGSSGTLTLPQLQAQPTPRPSTLHGGYMTAADAIRYIADKSGWAAPHAGGIPQHPRFAAIEEFVRAARDGQIHVIGRLNRTGSHQLIPQLYWIGATIDPESIFTPNQAGSTESTNPRRDGFVYYGDLHVERVETFRVWPRSPHAWMSR